MRRKWSLQKKVIVIVFAVVLIENILGCVIFNMSGIVSHADEYYQLRRLSFWIVAATLLVGGILATVAARIIVLPVEDMIDKIKQEQTEQAAKMEALIELADLGISVGEIRSDHPKRVICTTEFRKNLNIQETAADGKYLPKERFDAVIEDLKKTAVEQDEKNDIYVFEFERQGKKQWTRFQMIKQDERILLLTTDVTKDVLDKKKIEYDRDFDLLTKLYNRRAFHVRMQKIMSCPEEIGVAAMVIIDLDNLKYVNDTYGHDCGDEYIFTAAHILRRHRNKKAVVARMSGDEFLYFVYGGESKGQLRRHLDKMFQRFKATQVILPDGKRIPIRASAGIAWYKEDGEDYTELIRYADFAMYTVKRTNKGSLDEFNYETYSQKSYLLQCKEELNQIIDKRLVKYMFQPIIDVRTGEVFAYEALMRPYTENIKTPLELLSLARSQSKLQYIEKLTIFKAMESFRNSRLAERDVKIFINSISNQLLSEEEYAEFAEENKKYLDRLVIEITEDEEAEKEIIEAKKTLIGKWGSGLAMDDFGDGYSSDKRLLEMNPDYVKIDRSLITGIHKDERKQMLFDNVVRFTEPYGIKVIAEGVETEEELEYLIHNGADYIQGFYTGRPTYQPNDISIKIKEKFGNGQKGQK